jgi:hypothetical protein
MNRSMKLLSFSLFSCVLMVTLLRALPAQADCTYRGKTYKTGESSEKGTCTPQGTWQ